MTTEPRAIAMGAVLLTALIAGCTHAQKLDTPHRLVCFDPTMADDSPLAAWIVDKRIECNPQGCTMENHNGTSTVYRIPEGVACNLIPEALPNED